MAENSEPQTSLPEVTFEEIKALKDLGGCRKTNKKFNPPIDLKQLVFSKQKEKLFLNLKKVYGQMKDIEELGNMMQRRRQNDEENRKRLLFFLVELKRILFSMEEKMRNHVFSEYGTTPPDSHIENFLQQMAYPPSKLVVAGETSSGKSTLLNIFISENKEKMLPAKLLSCTATICEMAYNDINEAFKITGDKQEKIDFADREKFIFKESENDGERRFDHDAVLMKLPSPFLKSGITLVDTPGIGESTKMSSVLKDYVSKNDVFGFVFTIASNRAGGVMPKFLNLLRELSSDEYLDVYGQRKFNPGCVIFVANFWDGVDEKDREPTKEKIFSELKALPFMSAFNPEQQVFFLDADFAFNCKQSSLVTDDFDHFIDGLSEFVWREQKRKLKATYKWLENCIQRVLHPVRSYIRRIKQTGSVRRKNRDKTLKYLEDIEVKFNEKVKEDRQLLEENISSATDTLHKYLNSEKAHTQMITWKPGDIPKDIDKDGDWVLIEIALDEAIDERLSIVLLDWEKDNKVITTSEGALKNKVVSHFEGFSSELEWVEREIRSTNQRLELAAVEGGEIGETMEDSFKFPPIEELKIEDRKFDVSFGATFGNEIMSSAQLENVKEAMQNGISFSRITRSKAKDKSIQTPVVNSDIEKYLANKAEYISKRAELIFKQLQLNKDFSKNVISQQLQTIKQYIDHSEGLTRGVIASNKSLLKSIAEEKRDASAVDKLFEPIENDLVKLFDEVLSFGKSNVASPDFYDYDFEDVRQLKWTTASLFSGLCKARRKLKSTRRSIVDPYMDVTFKKFRGYGSPGLRPSDKYLQEKNLRQFVKTQNVVTLLGTYHWNTERVLVLDGNLKTARDALMGGKNQLKQAERVMMMNAKTFLSNLGQAVTFLHLRKLVHVEMSLDSILVKHGQYIVLPLLTNIGEPTKVPLCREKGIKLGHYINLPPEVLKEKTLYTQEADIYGLGIIMMELWYLKSIFRELSESKTLGEWIKLENTGEALINEATNIQRRHKLGQKMTDNWKRIATACLNKNPMKRPTAKLWQREIEALNEQTFSA